MAGGMPSWVGKQIVICLDGTNNKVKGADNTNVLRTYQMLQHGNPDQLVSLYQPGVGTFSAPGAWTVTGRKVTKILGLAFGVGLRQNLGNAYASLMDQYEDGDEIFVFGFSRGAYTARALTGMLAAFGLFRLGAENLIPYAIEAMSPGDADTAPRPGLTSAPAGDDDLVTAAEARPVTASAAAGQEKPSEKDWRLLFEFSDTFARRGGNGAIVAGEVSGFVGHGRGSRHAPATDPMAPYPSPSARGDGAPRHFYRRVASAVRELLRFRAGSSRWTAGT